MRSARRFPKYNRLQYIRKLRAELHVCIALLTLSVLTMGSGVLSAVAPLMRLTRVDDVNASTVHSAIESSRNVTSAG